MLKFNPSKKELLERIKKLEDRFEKLFYNLLAYDKVVRQSELKRFALILGYYYHVEPEKEEWHKIKSKKSSKHLA